MTKSMSMVTLAISMTHQITNQKNAHNCMIEYTIVTIRLNKSAYKMMSNLIPNT